LKIYFLLHGKQKTVYKSETDLLTLLGK